MQTRRFLLFLLVFSILGTSQGQASMSCELLLEANQVSPTSSKSRFERLKALFTNAIEAIHKKIEKRSASDELKLLMTTLQSTYVKAIEKRISEKEIEKALQKQIELVPKFFKAAGVEYEVIRVDNHTALQIKPGDSYLGSHAARISRDFGGRLVFDPIVLFRSSGQLSTMGGFVANVNSVFIGTFALSKASQGLMEHEIGHMEVYNGLLNGKASDFYGKAIAHDGGTLPFSDNPGYQRYISFDEVNSYNIEKRFTNNQTKQLFQFFGGDKSVSNQVSLITDQVLKALAANQAKVRFEFDSEIKVKVAHIEISQDGFHYSVEVPIVRSPEAAQLNDLEALKYQLNRTLQSAMQSVFQ